MARRKAEPEGWMNKYVLSLLFILLVAMLVVGVAAKYVYQNQGVNLVVAREFYFTSNLLMEDGEEYILNTDSKEVTFTLGNNADALRFSEDDISYEISAEGGAVLSTSEGVLDKGNVSVVNITLSGLENGKTYTVTATGKAGYKKTLSASFTVSKTDECLYKHLDTSNDAYVLLTVWANKLKGDATIKFPAGLIPDSTDLTMRNIRNYDNGVYNSDSFADTNSFQENYSSQTYRFFIDDAKTISADEFTIKLEDAESKVHLATEATPK